MEDKTVQSTNSSNITTFAQCTNTAQETESDPELDDLLDSAAKEFLKTVSTNSSKTCDTDTEVGETQECGGNRDDGLAIASGNINCPFIGKDDVYSEAQKQLEDMMKTFMKHDPLMMENIEKLAEAAACKDKTESGKKQFEQTVQEALGNIALNTDSQGKLPHQKLFNLLGNLNGEDLPSGDDGEKPILGDMNSFMPMMHGMMNNLLSKDVLYPSLKGVAEKYPSWLEENKDKESSKDLEKYHKQCQYMKKICSIYEEENESDTDVVKKERSENILQLVQQMQALGYPPKELILLDFAFCRKYFA